MVRGTSSFAYYLYYHMIAIYPHSQTSGCYTGDAVLSQVPSIPIYAVFPASGILAVFAWRKETTNYVWKVNLQFRDCCDTSEVNKSRD